MHRRPTRSTRTCNLLPRPSLFRSRQGRARGSDGKSWIQPRTLAVANGIFGPSSEEIAWARRIAAAHAAALAEGRAVVLVDGKLVEALHVAEAQRLVALAEEIASIEAAEA